VTEAVSSPPTLRSPPCTTAPFSRVTGASKMASDCATSFPATVAFPPPIEPRITPSAAPAVSGRSAGPSAMLPPSTDPTKMPLCTLTAEEVRPTETTPALPPTPPSSLSMPPAPAPAASPARRTSCPPSAAPEEACPRSSVSCGLAEVPREMRTEPCAVPVVVAMVSAPPTSERASAAAPIVMMSVPPVDEIAPFRKPIPPAVTPPAAEMVRG